MKQPDIVAKEGMWLTDGETFSKSVYLGKNDCAENWHEITEVEYKQILKEREEAREI